jgi:phosphatidylserine/phosphatidylglycerophosphate/cardiolipin synthase-like enzyme
MSGFSLVRTNFTKAAEESNAENVIVISGHADVAEAYEKNFNEHLVHSVKYEGVKPTTQPTK